MKSNASSNVENIYSHLTASTSLQFKRYIARNLFKIIQVCTTVFASFGVFFLLRVKMKRFSIR